MRKLIVLSFLSLDGVVQAPGGTEEDTSGGFTYGGWVLPYFDEEAGDAMGEQISPPFDLLLGRKTYDIFASYWPHHSEEWPGVNEATKYVASRSMPELNWVNSVLLQGDITEAVKKLKEGEGPDIQVHGSGNLAAALMRHNLVDEYWLKIFPVILGKGKRLFDEGAVPAAFSLYFHKVTPAGVIFANYRLKGDIATGSF